MNIPNRLTMIRILLIPVFLVLYMFRESIPYGEYVACAVFVITSLTDFLDGYIARKHHLVTDFGKFMDPLADKLLVCTALILFVWSQMINPLIVIVIVSRDFIISGVRSVAASKGRVIAASWWGKIKTVMQMMMIIMLLLEFNIPALKLITTIVVWVAFALTVISLLDYLWKNRDILIKGTK